jgi:hypothetical protein
MIDIYKTTALKKIKEFQPNSNIIHSKQHEKPIVPKSIHKKEQNFTVPDEEDIYISSLNKLKLKEYNFELFGIWAFLRNLIVTFVSLLILRYLGMILFGYFLSGSPLFLKTYFGFLPVVGYNTSIEISNQINVLSIAITAILPTLILIFWSFKGQSLTTVPRTFELVYKEINFLEFGSGIYKDALKMINKFVPKFFYEFILVWYFVGFFGILQYVVMYFFSESKQFVGFNSDIWKFVFLVLINTWIVLVWNKKVKDILAQWRSIVEDE